MIKYFIVCNFKKLLITYQSITSICLTHFKSSLQNQQPHSSNAKSQQEKLEELESDNLKLTRTLALAEVFHSVLNEKYKHIKIAGWKTKSAFQCDLVYRQNLKLWSEICRKKNKNVGLCKRKQTRSAFVVVVFRLKVPHNSLYQCFLSDVTEVTDTSPKLGTAFPATRETVPSTETVSQPPCFWHLTDMWNIQQSISFSITLKVGIFVEGCKWPKYAKLFSGNLFLLLLFACFFFVSVTHMK